MTPISVAVTGGSWITAEGSGRLRDGSEPALIAGRALVPDRREVFDSPPVRYGRFDYYTKLGCSAVAFALGDAGLDDASEKRPIGIVTSSVFESSMVDHAYYESVIEEGGAPGSPNLFSYTLPGIMQGESAVHFGLTGPTVCVGDDGGRGLPALQTALRIIGSRDADIMIAGWLDDPPEAHLLESDANPECVGGALFVVLERRPRQSYDPILQLRYDRGRTYLDSGREVSSLADLFSV